MGESIVEILLKEKEGRIKGLLAVGEQLERLRVKKQMRKYFFRG